MFSQRAPKVFRLVRNSFGIIAILIPLIVTVAQGQIPAPGQRNLPSARLTRQEARSNSPGSSLFLPAVPYGSGGLNTLSAVVADVNGDGKPDLVVLNECTPMYCSTSTVGVLLGNGDGTFQPVTIEGETGWFGVALAVGDIDGDEKPDIVVANFLSSTVNVMLNNGDGTFRPAVTYSSGGYWATAVAIADVNGDGKADLVVGHAAGPGQSLQSVSVLLGNGDGTFQTASVYDTGGSSVSAVLVADINWDHKPDLIVANACGGGNCANQGSIAVLLGNGDGTFQSPLIYGSGAYLTQGLSVADVNSDGNLDVIVANCTAVGPAPGYGNANCGNGDGVIGVLLGNGDGTLKPVRTLDSGGISAGALVAADFNGDGNIDLALLTNTQSGSMAVLLGNGDGTFQAPIGYDTEGSYAASIAVADLNGDGRVDLIVANQLSTCSYCGGGSLGILLNNSAPENPTTTTLGSLVSSSVYGQIVSFHVNVMSTAGTPTGTAEILSGSTVVGTGTLVKGSVSIPVSTLPAGSDSVSATYLGGGGFAISKSAPLTQTVAPAATATSLASSLNPAATNQAVTFTATVTSQYGGAATGLVIFYSGSQALGTAALSGNTAALTIAFPTSGTYSITAKYLGDGNNTGSTSGSLNQVIITSTMTTLTSSPNPAVVGQAITFTAVVTSARGTPPNGESVTFYSGSAVLGVAGLSGGVATLTTSSLGLGIYTITATYAGDSTFASSTSAGVRQAVNSTSKSATLTSLASSLNPSIYGQRVTFTATVTNSGGSVPTGKVSFTWGGIHTIGGATLDGNGVATLSMALLNTDTYPLTAVYHGDANNLGSISPIFNQVVTQATSTATITSSVNPSAPGQAVTFTAKITSPTVIAKGPVTFTAGTIVLGTVELVSGKATLTTTSLAAGSTQVTVTYSGDSNIAKSSAAVTQVVQ